MSAEEILARLRRALSLDPAAFEELRDDSAFTPIAAGAAALAIFIGGLGTWLWAVFQDAGDRSDFFVEGTILGSIFAALLWLAGVAVIYLLLTQFYRETVAPDALFRVAAVASLPFALGVLVCIPGIGFGIGLLSIALMFMMTVFGIRAAFPSVTPPRAVLSVAAGFALWALILPLLSSADDAFSPGAFVFEWAEDVVEDRR